MIVFEKRLLTIMLTIVNEWSSLTIINKGLLFTIVNERSLFMIVNKGLSLTIINKTAKFIKTVVLGKNYMQLYRMLSYMKFNSCGRVKTL